jgi:hypothetical protein
MKPRLINLVLLIVCFSCGTNNKPLSDTQKEKIKGEIKALVDTGFKGCEEANVEKATNLFIDSPDFVFIDNENSLDYKQFLERVKLVFSTLINQKGTINEEKCIFLDNSTVIYENKGTNIANYKDGHAIFSDPIITQFTFRRINDKWRAINLVQTSVNKPIENTETSNGLNQVELNKQWMGTWKWEGANDTAIFWDNKPYGTGLEGHIKFVTKGKVFTERKEFAGYSKEYDKYISAQMTKGEEIEISAYWFTSKNRCTQVPFEYILNPEKASYRIEMEFKSPDSLVATIIVNNKTVSIDTVERVKL